MPAVLVTGQTAYTELAVSSPAVAETIATTYCTYTQRNGQAEWPGIVDLPKVTNPSTSQARWSLTLIIQLLLINSTQMGQFSTSPE